MTARTLITAAAALMVLIGCQRADSAPASVEEKRSSPQEAPMSDDTPLNISGDRNAPEAVPPVVRNGVQFEQNLGASEAEFGQVGGVLSARDVKTKALLWSITVYENKRRPDVEGDAQDVFFRSMAFDAKGSLIIENERAERFAVDVNKRTVAALP